MKYLLRLFFLYSLAFIPVLGKGQVLEEDKLILIEFFENLNPEAQEKLNWNENDFNNPVSSWLGVELRDNRVIGLSVSNKDVSGAIPKAVGDLSALEKLSFNFNPNLTQIPNQLPSGLHELECDSTNISALPNPLPNGLRRLICRRNSNLTTLPNPLPDSLRFLDFVFCNVNSLPDPLPPELRELYAGGNNLKSLPNPLPEKLNVLGCSINRIRELPPLPPSLDTLGCRENLLTSLPTLPLGLKYLDCRSNYLSSFPNHLDSLSTLFHCQENFFTFEDIVPFLESNGSIQNLVYAPQRSLGRKEYYVHSNKDITINILEDTLFDNIYTWRKEMDFLSEEKMLQLNNVTKVDTGLYRFEASNPRAPDLILRGEVLLKIYPSENLPIDTTTIIVRYAPDVTPAEVNQQQQILEEEGWELLRECHCGGEGIPRLQLYAGFDKTLLELNTLRSSRKSRIASDTTLFNHKLIHDIAPEVITRAGLVCQTSEIVPSEWEYLVSAAFIDTGGDPHHPDLKGWYWRNPEDPFADGNCFDGDAAGWDFLNSIPDIVDFDGHGTHGIGILRSDYPQDIQLKIQNLKVFELGRGLLFDLVCAIHYAVDAGVDLINISMGYYDDEPSPILYEALQRAREAGIIVVVSAGNEGLNVDNLENNQHRWPGHFKTYGTPDGTYQPLDNIIVVAALDQEGVSLAPYSNVGSASVDLAAPGTGIKSTLPLNDYGHRSGTSMAAAFVSRLVSILRAYRPEASYTDIIGCIRSSLDKLSGAKSLVWNGKINEEKALNCLGVSSAPNLSLLPDSLGSFPNPFRDLVTIELTEPGEMFREVDIRIYNSMGQMVFQEVCSAQRLEWRGRDNNGNVLPPGVYLAEVTLDRKRRFLVELVKQ